MDLVQLGVEINPRAANTGASQFQSLLAAMSQAATKMQAAVDAASKQAGGSLANAGAAGSAAGNKIADGGKAGAKGVDETDAAARRAKNSLESMGSSLSRIMEFAGGGLLQELISGGIERALDIPAEIIQSGLEYNDMVQKTTISLAGMVSAQRPDLVHQWSDALRVADEVIASMQTRVQQFHFSSLAVLQDEFNSVATGTNGWGISLKQQLDLADSLLAAFRAKNIDGQQAARDSIDLLMGRGERVVAAREIMQRTPGNADSMDLGTFNEDLKKVEDGVMSADVLVKGLMANISKYSAAAEQGNSILSTSYEALKGQIEKAIGGETQSLYTDLVDQTNRVRAVIGSSDFADGMKPMVEYLKQAVDLAGNLAVALAVDPKDFPRIFGDVLNAVIASSIEYAISELPKLEPAVENAWKASAPILFDVMFQAAAILTTAVESILAQVAAKTRLLADDANVGAWANGQDLLFGPGKWSDPNEIAAIKQRDKDRQLAVGGFSPDEYNQNIASRYKANLASSADMQRGFMDSLGLPQDLGGPAADADAKWKIVQADMADVKARADAIKAANAGAPPQPIPADLTKPGGVATPDADQQHKLDLMTLDRQMNEDKAKLLAAQAQSDTDILNKAEAVVKVDEYKKQLLESQKFTMAEINALAAGYAELEAAHLALGTQKKTNLEEQKALLGDVNAAEEAAAAARAQVTAINGDPFMTQLAKRSELLLSYDKEISDLQAVIRLNQEAINSGALKDQSAIAQRQKQIDSSSQEIARAQNDRKLQTDSGVFQGDMVKFYDSLGSVGKDSAQLLTGTLNTAIDSVTANIIKAQNGTETWGQAFTNITTTILSDLEEMILKMGLQLALQESLSALSPGTFGAAGGASMLLAGHHAGGIVGMEPSFNRVMPRFHTGGVSSDEQVAVLKKDEGVFTPGQMKAMGDTKQAPAAPAVHVHIMQASNPHEIAEYLNSNPDVIFSAMSRKPGIFKQLAR